VGEAGARAALIPGQTGTYRIMNFSEHSLWLVGLWVVGLGLGVAVLPGLLWLRLRRIRLQVEARYLSAVAEFDPQTPNLAALFARIHGESIRRLLQGLVGPGVSPGPASWKSRGWLRYDSDDRERLATAETYCIPGLWWAQVRRVRLRFLGWIDEIHELEAGHVTSGYWWLGLYRVAPPGFGPSPLTLQAQALGEGVLAPWGWFLDGVIDWDGSLEASELQGRVAATGHKVQLRLDPAGRPATLDLLDSGSHERVRVEYFGWRWLDRALLPERLRLIENAGSVNEFVRLEMRLAPPVRAPAPDA